MKLFISVTDTGVGIAPEEQKMIFREFTRLDTNAPGGGVGLAASRRIARLLRGDVVVESTPGRESTFTLVLPLVDGARGVA